MAEILEEIRISAMYNPVKLGKIYLPRSHWVGTQLILMGDGHIFQFFNEKHTTSLTPWQLVSPEKLYISSLPSPSSSTRLPR